MNPADYHMRRLGFGLMIFSGAVMLVLLFALWGALH